MYPFNPGGGNLPLASQNQGSPCGLGGRTHIRLDGGILYTLSAAGKRKGVQLGGQSIVQNDGFVDLYLRREQGMFFLVLEKDKPKRETTFVRMICFLTQKINVAD